MLASFSLLVLVFEGAEKDSTPSTVTAPARPSRELLPSLIPPGNLSVGRIFYANFMVRGRWDQGVEPGSFSELFMFQPLLSPVFL